MTAGAAQSRFQFLLLPPPRASARRVFLLIPRVHLRSQGFSWSRLIVEIQIFSPHLNLELQKVRTFTNEYTLEACRQTEKNLFKFTILEGNSRRSTTISLS